MTIDNLLLLTGFAVVVLVIVVFFIKGCVEKCGNQYDFG